MIVSDFPIIIMGMQLFVFCVYEMSWGIGLLFDNQGHKHIPRYINETWQDHPLIDCSGLYDCLLVWGNFVSWKGKTQCVVARSSSEINYREMVVDARELY